MASPGRVGRLPLKGEVKGSDSVRSKAFGAVLFHIDWAIYTGSDIWTKVFPPEEALQAVIDTDRPEKMASPHGNWIVPHTVETLWKAIANWMTRDGHPNLKKFKGPSAQALFSRGSKSVAPQSLVKIKYEWEEKRERMIALRGEPERSAIANTPQSIEILSLDSASTHTAASNEPGHAQSSPSASSSTSDESEDGAAQPLANDLPKRTSADRRIELMPDCTRFFLDDCALKAGLQNIFDVLCHTVRSQLRVQGVDLEQAAKLQYRPSPRLEAAYRTLLEPLRHQEPYEQAAKENFDSDDFAIALVCVTLHQTCLTGEDVRPLLFEQHYQDIRSLLRNEWALGDQRLHRFRTDLDTTFREAYRLSLDTKEKQSQMLQAVNMVIWTIVEILQEHLHDPFRVAPISDAQVTHQWWESLDRPVLDAMKLRCEVSCARERYVFRWPQRWEVFDQEWTETRDGDGGRAVGATFFPGLAMERDDGGLENISRAMVKAI